MESNAVIETMLNRKSIRRYTDEPVPDEVLTAIVRAGQQAPFAYQLCSLLLSRNREKNTFGAPLLFTICVDSHRLELIMARRGWEMVQNDLSLLLFGIQDAALMAENMVIAADSLGLGSCFLGNAPYRAGSITEEYKLPKRVFPLVQLAMGYPAEDPPPRPRYPLEFTFFEDEYPELSEELIARSMAEMDEGYMAQNYYRKVGFQNTYGWTEHISRKVGQWDPDPEAILEPLALCGFHVGD
jgi:nitroreductase